MKTRLLALLPLCLLVIAGCNPKTAVEGKTDNPPKTDKSVNVGGLDETTRPAANQTVPAELMHEGYEYYGLGNTSPVEMVIRIPDQEARTGTQQIELKELKEGKAIYSIKRTGGLEALGDEEVLLTKDGIFAYKAGTELIKPQKLELPGVITPGRKWPTDSQFTGPNGNSLKQKSTTKIVGMEKTKTPSGEVDALVVSESGSFSQQGVTTPVTARMWLVKGKGVVKLEVKTKPQGGAEQTLVIEVTK